MTAVDTNIVVRLLTEDHAKQAAVARSLFAGEPIWIAKTVLLETHWVLRRLYGFDDAAIVDTFKKLLGLDNVHAEDASSVAAALAMTDHGVGLPDALHLCSGPSGVRFVSFDRSFVRRAQRAGANNVAEISG